jgi:hypothetical protein
LGERQAASWRSCRAPAPRSRAVESRIDYWPYPQRRSSNAIRLWLRDSAESPEICATFQKDRPIRFGDSLLGRYSDKLLIVQRIDSRNAKHSGPTVLVCCHPVKHAGDDNLLPRGGAPSWPRSTETSSTRRTTAPSNCTGKASFAARTSRLSHFNFGRSPTSD